MRMTFCVACGTSNGQLHHHHMVPRVLGGPDTADNMLTLCAPCHDKMHRLQVKGLLNMDTLVEIGKLLAVADGRLSNTAGANLTSASAHDLAQARAEECREIAEDFITEVGATATMHGLALRLEQAGMMTPQGKPTWTNTTVYNLIGRLGIDWVKAKRSARAGDKLSARHRHEQRVSAIETERSRVKPIFDAFISEYKAVAGQEPPISLTLAKINEQTGVNWSRTKLTSAMRTWLKQ
jgi:hypothetical protein